ncbi:MAG: hypothetical protein FWE27_01885 [Defluviitaleaceae bacterium]|nr:hypothetical protein [Defluviitaleaceae bacterium]
MKRKLSTRVTCLVVACVVLASAITVSAVNGSPYEQLKNAVFDALFFENYTMEGEFTIRVNGEITDREKAFISQGNTARLNINSSWSNTAMSSFNATTGGSLEYTAPPSFQTTTGDSLNYTTTGGSLAMNTSGEYRTKFMDFYTDRLSVSANRWDLNAGQQWYSVEVYENMDDTYWDRSRSNSNRLIDDMFYGRDTERDSNSVRLMELVLDLVVGDLKHIVSMTTRDGSRYISGEITGNQFPEIIRLLVDMSVEDRYMYITDNIRAQSIEINRIRGEAEIDSAGNLAYIGCNINIIVTDTFDETHDIEFDVSLRFSDIGTSNPQSPVPGVEELFTLKFMQANFERQWRSYSAFFTLDADGNIDIESITDRVNRNDSFRDIDNLCDCDICNPIESEMEEFEWIENYPHV